MSSLRILYLFVCGAGPAARISEMVRLAQEDDWDVHCIATASAVEHFLDVDELASTSGHAVRTTYRKPGDGSIPDADAVVVAPATFNSINKWAAGVADTYPLTQLAELTGLGVKIAVLPFVNLALADNPAFSLSVEHLRRAGVRVLIGPGEFEPHPPRTGDTAIEKFPWQLALEAVRGIHNP